MKSSSREVIWINLHFHIAVNFECHSLGACRLLNHIIAVIYFIQKIWIEPLPRWFDRAAINRSLLSGLPLDFTLSSVCQVMICSWEYDWARRQTDMILWLLQPGCASFRRRSLWIPLRFFSATIKKHWQTAFEFTVLFYSSHQRTHFIFAVTPLTLRLLHFVRPERQAALCYQGKVHLFRVSSWDGFWVSESRSLFLTQLPAFSFFFFSVFFFLPLSQCVMESVVSLWNIAYTVQWR